TLLRTDYGHMKIRYEQGGESFVIRTLTLFVGNNRLQLDQIGIDAGPLLRAELAAVILRPVGRLEMLWLLLRGATGRLDEARNVTSFGFRQMTVTAPVSSGNRRVKVAADGEIFFLEWPLAFRVSERPLKLIVPAASEAAGMPA